MKRKYKQSADTFVCFVNNKNTTYQWPLHISSSEKISANCTTIRPIHCLNKQKTFRKTLIILDLTYANYHIYLIMTKILKIIFMMIN